MDGPVEWPHRSNTALENTSSVALKRIPPRKMPTYYKSEVKKLISDIFDQNIIILSTSPWSVPVTLVKK